MNESSQKPNQRDEPLDDDDPKSQKSETVLEEFEAKMENFKQFAKQSKVEMMKQEVDVSDHSENYDML